MSGREAVEIAGKSPFFFFLKIDIGFDFTG
jgi:hypothetical protein